MTDANRFSLSYGLLKTSVLYFHGARTVRQGLLIAKYGFTGRVTPAAQAGQRNQARLRAPLEISPMRRHLWFILP